MHRLTEGHGIDGDGDARPMSVTHGADRAALIDQAHDHAAMNIAERVGVLGRHQVMQGDARKGGRFFRCEGHAFPELVFGAT